MTVHDHTIFSANCARETIQFSYKICSVANIVCMLSHVDVNYVFFCVFMKQKTCMFQIVMKQMKTLFLLLVSVLRMEECSVLPISQNY